MRVCAIDIGTNSVRTLIAEVAKDGRITPLWRSLEISRLGKGLGNHRDISTEAADRTIAAINKPLSTAECLKVKRFVIFGTCALREANNARFFIDSVKRSTGHPVRILSGEEEADWIYKGVAQALVEDIDKFLIIDIGGGSTEFVTLSKDKKPLLKSLGLGCVKLTEKFIRSDPPRESEINSLRRFVSRTLSKDLPELSSIGKKLIGAGGTVTTAAAMSLGLTRYEPDSIHGYGMKLDEVGKISENLMRLTLKERKRTAGLEEERADIIAAGLLILRGVMEFCKADEIIVTDEGILYGAVGSVAPAGT